MKKLNKNNKGFSLVELLVVIAIMVVLIGVVAPSLLGNIEKAREAKDIQALDTIAGNIQAAMVNEDVYDAIVGKAGKAINLKNAYDGTAFTSAESANYANANTKLKDSLTDVLAKASVYGGTSEAINLFGSKTAKAAIKDDSAAIYFSVDPNTGKVKVSLGKEASGVVATAKGKSVDFEVER